jgi:hypothetical protein
MTLSELFIGKLQGESEFRSVNALATKYGLSWVTVRRALNYTARRVKKLRGVLRRVQRRRGCVARLAKKRVLRHGREHPVHHTVSAIKKALSRRGICASRATVWRDLHASGLSSRVRRRVPTRDPVVIEKRHQFCVNWLQRSKDFKRVVFSDEHTVSINDHTSRTMWVGPDDEVIPRERRRLHNIPRVMIWAAVGVGFKSPIVLFPGVAKHREGDSITFRLNTDGYVRRCLSKVASSLADSHRIFQQDGAKPHQTNRVRDYLGRKGVAFIPDWPPYSPDLNMVERVWPLLNERISEQHPTTLSELKSAIKKAWRSIKQSEIDALCKGFGGKLQEVLANGGRCK